MLMTSKESVQMARKTGGTLYGRPKGLFVNDQKELFIDDQKRKENFLSVAFDGQFDNDPN